MKNRKKVENNGVLSTSYKQFVDNLCGHDYNNYVKWNCGKKNKKKIYNFTKKSLTKIFLFHIIVTIFG